MTPEQLDQAIFEYLDKNLSLDIHYASGYYDSSRIELKLMSPSGDKRAIGSIILSHLIDEPL